MGPQHLILFDGECDFCRRQVERVSARDKGLLFIPIAYQEAPSPPMTPALFMACQRAVHVVQHDGTILKAGKAVLFIMEHTGLGVPARILAHPPFLWFVEFAYGVVARNRSFFGRFI